MANRKKNYWPRKRHVIAKQTAETRKNRVTMQIRRNKVNLADKYIDFLKALVTKQ